MSTGLEDHSNIGLTDALEEYIGNRISFEDGWCAAIDWVQRKYYMESWNDLDDMQYDTGDE